MVPTAKIANKRNTALNILSTIPGFMMASLMNGRITNEYIDIAKNVIVRLDFKNEQYFVLKRLNKLSLIM